MLAPLTTCLTSNRRLSASGRFRRVDGAAGGAAAQHEQAVPKRVDDGLNVLASRLRAAREVDDQRSVDDARRRARKAAARGDGHRRGAHGLGDARCHAAGGTDDGRRQDERQREDDVEHALDHARRSGHDVGEEYAEEVHDRGRDRGDPHRVVQRIPVRAPIHPSRGLGQKGRGILSQSRYAVASGVKPTSLKHFEASEPLRNSRKSLAPSACGAFFIAAAG